MPTYGAVVIGRNDNYGENLVERASYCLNGLIEQMDEVIYVDWNTNDTKPTLTEEIGDGLIKSPNFYTVRVSEKQAREWTILDPQAQNVCEVLARNVGLRRLSTDYLISTNIDVIPPHRSYLDRTIQTQNTFFTTGLRCISLYDVRPIGTPFETEKIRAALEIKKVGWFQEGATAVCPGDRYSVVSRPGDFQIAPRNIWYTVRGFEESLTGRAFADSNVQRKAAVYGFGLAVDREIPVWHIGHEAGYGGSGRENDMKTAIFMEATSNPPTWGHIEAGLEMVQYE